MLEYIRVEKRILRFSNGVITNHKSGNSAKKHSRTLQTTGLGRGQLRVADKFPPGDYSQVEYSG